MRLTKDCSCAGGRFLVRVTPVLRDNYSYIVQCNSTKKLAFVDVSNDFEPVFAEAKKLLGKNELTKDDVPLIFSTHKHHDHTGGNAECAKAIPGVTILAGEHEPVPHKTASVADNAVIEFGALKVHCLAVPYHTEGHANFRFYSDEDKADGGAVFVGDSLFIGGCGAAFSGDFSLMVKAFQKMAKHWPPSTRTFCGHEYTLNFLKFAETIEPNNNFLREFHARCKAQRAGGEATVPSTAFDEAHINVFWRAAIGAKDLLERLPAHARVSPEAAMEYLYNQCP